MQTSLTPQTNHFEAALAMPSETLMEMQDKLRAMKSNPARRRIESVVLKKRQRNDEGFVEWVPRTLSRRLYHVPIGPVYVEPKLTDEAFELHYKKIKKIIAREHGVTVEMIDGDKKTKDINPARAKCYWALRFYKGFTLKQIGNHVGGRDHTSVLHGIRRHCEDTGDPLPDGIVGRVSMNKKREDRRRRNARYAAERVNND